MFMLTMLWEYYNNYHTPNSGRRVLKVIGIVLLFLAGLIVLGAIIAPPSHAQGMRTQTARAWKT
jgi:hypothetical protein